MIYCFIKFYINVHHSRANVTLYCKTHEILVGDDGVFSLKFGRSPPFDRSLFTDTELNTCELDLTLMTQRTERERKHFITGDTSLSF